MTSKGDCFKLASANTLQRSQIDVLRKNAERDASELFKWRHWVPDDETLAELKKQYGNGDGKAARLIYVMALEAIVRNQQ